MYWTKITPNGPWKISSLFLMNSWGSPWACNMSHFISESLLFWDTLREIDIALCVSGLWCKPTAMSSQTPDSPWTTMESFTCPLTKSLPPTPGFVALFVTHRSALLGHLWPYPRSEACARGLVWGRHLWIEPVGLDGYYLAKKCCHDSEKANTKLGKNWHTLFKYLCLLWLHFFVVAIITPPCDLGAILELIACHQQLAPLLGHPQRNRGNTTWATTILKMSLWVQMTRQRRTSWHDV